MSHRPRHWLYSPIPSLLILLLAACGAREPPTPAVETASLVHVETKIHASQPGMELGDLGLHSWAVVLPTLRAPSRIDIIDVVALDATGTLGSAVTLTPVGRDVADAERNPRNWLANALRIDRSPVSISSGSSNVVFGVILPSSPSDGRFSLGLRYQEQNEPPKLLNLDIHFQVTDEIVTVTLPYRYPSRRTTMGPRGGGVR